MLWGQENTELQSVQQRIEPIGKVHIQEDIQKKSLKENQMGRKVYDRYCVVCHRDGLVGAPKLGAKSDWKNRLAAKKIEGLILSATKGINAMPVKGTCYECTEQELKAAIEFMLPKS